MTSGVKKVSKWSNLIHKKRTAKRIWMNYLSFFSPQQLYFVVNHQNSFCRFFSVAYGWIRLSIIQIRISIFSTWILKNSDDLSSAFSCHQKQMIAEFFRNFVGKVDDFPWWMMSNFRTLTCKRHDMNSLKKHELLSQHILYFIFSWL